MIFSFRFMDSTKEILEVLPNFKLRNSKTRKISEKLKSSKLNLSLDCG